MSVESFDTPEAAAMSGFPAAHCRVVAVAAEGDDAYVLVDTDPGGSGYLYGVAVRRVNGRWEEGSSGNGPGWTATDGELGTWVQWGRASRGTRRVEVSFNDEVREVPVQNGVYLAAWWRVPAEAVW